MSAKWLPFCFGLDVLTCHIAIPCIAEHEVVEKIKLSHSFHKVFVVIVSTAKWGVFCEYKVCPDSKGHGAQLGPVGPMLAPWTLLSGWFLFWLYYCSAVCIIILYYTMLQRHPTVYYYMLMGKCKKDVTSLLTHSALAMELRLSFTNPSMYIGHIWNS